MHPFRAPFQAIASFGAVAAFLSVLLLTAQRARCQSVEDSWTTTVRGVVLDSVTKKPVPQAVVYVDRDPPEPRNSAFHRGEDGTDGGQQQTTGPDGRFASQGLTFSAHYFKVAKEGYIPNTPGRFQPGVNRPYSSYEVHVGPKMEETRFFLTPAAKIEGRVLSESGEPMKNILLTLLSGVVEDGRTIWRRDSVLPTDSDGNYSFPNLAPGAYVVLSDWMFDNDPEPAHGKSCGTSRFIPAGGFPPAAYPGVLDFSAAQTIHLGAGRVETADFRLPHRVFHPVTWLHNLDSAQGSFSSLRTGNGRKLELVSRPDSNCGRPMPEKLEPGAGTPPNNMLIGGRETIHLPDGNYSVTIRHGFSKDEGPGKFMSLWLGEFADFTVAGKPLTLAYPRALPKPQPSVSVRTRIDMATEGARCSGLTSSAFSGSSYDDGKPSWHTLWLTRADPLPMYERAIPLSISRDGRPEFYSLEAGKYWVHAVEPGEAGPFAEQTNTYVASVTSGGADMAKEPLVIGPDGTAPQLEVTAGTNCGILHLKYAPDNPYQERYGIVRSFYGLLVPQFAAFETVHSFPFEPGRPQDISVGNLTPGHYKFYVSPRVRGFAFRENHDAPADLGPGQDVWLKSGEKVEVAVVEPAQE